MRSTLPTTARLGGLVCRQGPYKRAKMSLDIGNDFHSLSTNASPKSLSTCKAWESLICRNVWLQDIGGVLHTWRGIVQTVSCNLKNCHCCAFLLWWEMCSYLATPGMSTFFTPTTINFKLTSPKWDALCCCFFLFCALWTKLSIA